MLGTVELGEVVVGLVLLGVVVLPGSHGLATVAEVPLGRDADAVVEVVELLLVVEELPAVAGVPVAVVEVVPLLLAGVHGATVDVVPVWVCVLPCVPPVTDPALPATPGVPCVAAGLPVEVLPGEEVCSVPMEPEVPDCVVEVVPVWVEVVPGWVLVVPWDVLVVGELGVTVPVLCAVARPTDSANTDVANKILRIESCSL